MVAGSVLTPGRAFPAQKRAVCRNETVNVKVKDSSVHGSTDHRLGEEPASLLAAGGI